VRAEAFAETQNLDRKSLRKVTGRAAGFADLGRDCVCSPPSTSNSTDAWASVPSRLPWPVRLRYSPARCLVTRSVFPRKSEMPFATTWTSGDDP
jgi:hypothetical protein